MRKRISSVLAGLLAALLLWGLAPVTAEAARGQLLRLRQRPGR